MLNRQDNIVESNAIREILKIISFNTWLVVDLDNTIMHPLQIREMEEAEGELGSDQWFEKLFLQAKALVHSQPSTVEQLLELYHEVQHQLLMQPVEENTVMIIQRLQDLGVPIVGLTARSEVLKETTIKQLQEIGINLEWIIFCDGKNKGECAERFLKGLPPADWPGHIVMIDDKKKHLESVKIAVEKLGIEFNGVRYGHLDAKVDSVDMEKAHLQLAKLKPRLPSSTHIIIEQLKLLPAEKSANLQLNPNQKEFSIEYQSASVQTGQYAPEEENKHIRIKM